MARRIAAAVVALIALLLGVVAVPLGLITAAHDNRAFNAGAVSSAASLAGFAEEKMADNSGGTALAIDIGQLRHGGDSVAVYDEAGRWLAGTPARPAVAAGALARARARLTPTTFPADDRLVVLAPVVLDETGTTIGVVALARPTAPLEHRVTVLWLSLGAVSLAGLLAAALLATALARWVSRPLSQLGAAAQRLGDGALETRSPLDAGPGEVRRLAANFNTMAGQLEALVDGHQAMMADVSHQLRTPLAALRLRLDVLAQECDDHVAVELAGAQEEIARLSRMVDGLLAVARAEKVVAEPVPVAVDAVIRDRAAAWRPAAEERDVTLAADGLAPVRARLGDGHLEQILDNLLANAFDAVPAGGTIRVGATASGTGAQVVVADDGPGMSPQQQRAAFRRFAGTTTPGGTGLGLAIVHRLVTSNGGSAVLSDTPGGGLTVTLQLPGAPKERAPRDQRDQRDTRRQPAISS
jgi:signal transduction histidine kinase